MPVEFVNSANRRGYGLGTWDSTTQTGLNAKGMVLSPGVFYSICSTGMKNPIRVVFYVSNHRASAIRYRKL